MRQGLLGGVLLLAVVLCMGRSGESTSLPFSITLESWSPYYRPSVAVVPSGTPIQWLNPTASPHTVRFDGCGTSRCLFDSGPIPADGQYTLPGLPPGRYPYHCELHPIMRGELVVRDQGTPQPAQDDQPPHPAPPGDH